MNRVIAWVSGGAASAVAEKLAYEKYGEQVEFVRIYIKDEHPDTDRFITEYENWLGVEVKNISSEKYSASVDKVIEKTRYMSGVYGARCTKELKKQVRFDFQKPSDLHVFGMDASKRERNRIDRLIDSEPELNIETPLIDNLLTKSDCFRIISDAGLTLPKMYQLGYNNNNCIGCLKASGAGYWNKIRKDFPCVFKTRAIQEELLGVALVRVTSTILEAKHPLRLRKSPNFTAQLKITKFVFHSECCQATWDHTRTLRLVSVVFFVRGHHENSRNDISNRTRRQLHVFSNAPYFAHDH